MIKNFFKRVGPYAWLIIPLVFSPTHYAHAYLDPGTGSYAIQAVIGVLFGGTYAVKSLFKPIINKIRGGSAKTKAVVTKIKEVNGE